MRCRELSVPESAYFLQAEENATPALDADSFSSQGSLENQGTTPAGSANPLRASATESRATDMGSAVSDSCHGSAVSEHWQGDCMPEEFGDFGFGFDGLDLGFDFKLPPFLQDVLKHCSAIDC
ncbi:unnamed protein product [Effrenium voratum]|nr:unnamed protein product [Effrenium voratum]CAJ1434729.1 unnamed protein product [Effrenium voratum]